MSGPAIPPLSALMSTMPAAPSAAQSRDPDKAHDSAQQFEALLIGQMLRSVRESGSSWLGSEDSSGECGTDYAEQQFAAVLAHSGGLGLANIITRGLEK
jgi:Rod binding domain-containing protein